MLKGAKVTGKLAITHAKANIKPNKTAVAELSKGGISCT